MEKVHLIGWALLISLLAGSAVTVTVGTIAEAQAELGSSPTLEQIGCKVYEIKKEATTQDEITNNPWTVEFAMEYSIDGKKTREHVRRTEVNDNNETAIKEAVAPICETDWQNAVTKHGTVDKVIIKNEDNPVLNQVYDAVKKTWANVSVEAP